jgi:roadblock/LC7 domain-containing protein
MAVMARESWTDERLDDLKATMDQGFMDMRAEFRAMRAEMAEHRAAAQAEFAAQHRSMVQLFAGMYAITVFGFLGVIAALVTQT